MKKSTRIRPVVESLESMMLLSTMVGEVHALAKAPAHVAPPVVTTVNLLGTLHGTGKLSGTTASVSGSGNLGKVGTASFKINANLTNPPTTVTLSTSKGNLYLESASPLVGSGSSGSTTYTILGGTKTYAHVTGAPGSVSATYSLLKGNKLTVAIHFS